MRKAEKTSLRIKVCGMTDPANIRDLLLLEPDFMGLIFYPGSARYVQTGSLIPEQSDRERTIRTGVFVNADPGYILEKARQYQLGAIQLHGSESASYCQQIRRLLTSPDQHAPDPDKSGIGIIKAFGIAADFDWDLLIPYAEEVDYFLFDTRSEQYGGTGKKFDWQLLRGYTLDKPYVLSGGIGETDLPEVMALAAQDARLNTVDLNSRYEIRPGLKDIHRLEKTFKLLRNGS